MVVNSETPEVQTVVKFVLVSSTDQSHEVHRARWLISQRWPERQAYGPTAFQRACYACANDCNDRHMLHLPMRECLQSSVYVCACTCIGAPVQVHVHCFTNISGASGHKTRWPHRNQGAPLAPLPLPGPPDLPFGSCLVSLELSETNST